MISQTVFDTSQVLFLKGIKHVVLSPGSRNAPLTVSFARNPHIKIYNIVDERSAGFIALGICQKLNEPVVLCCTSGTSLLNYGPAVAEAHYQQLPLIVMSADRPVEWLDQRDGQTINQPGALSNFVKKTFQLPSVTDSKDGAWEYNRKLNEAINLAVSGPMGPVHINIPFREPFYPKAEDLLQFSNAPRLINVQKSIVEVEMEDWVTKSQSYSKKLIICGQNAYNPVLSQSLGQIKDAVIVADVIANVHGDFIRHQDLFLGNISDEVAASLQPDLIISFGKSVISKSLKQFLRKYPAKEHWHIDVDGVVADTFLQLTDLICSKPTDFFQKLRHAPFSVTDFERQITQNYIQSWKLLNENTARRLNEEISEVGFCEFQAFHLVQSLIPKNADLHLANSMPVRFSNFIQDLPEGVEVYCNRGTSGIDGTNGTAVGNALVAQKSTWLLTGDLSFFYDRNAFFHPHEFNSLKIIVFNNNGGGIFRLIPGPSALPELVRHFETRHQHSAKFTAAEYGFDYYVAKDLEGVKAGMEKITSNNKSPQLLEIFTDPEINSVAYQEIKKALKI